ncbi:bifunctional transcriptional activator/DNA repair enzyme AdaA [Paenibacillus sp. N4]|uniref:bifunctional transcriptional activator/DNA repair enzyme AdaA n=1 Tax=Paenibacillus vietnamensis TaxID=2590547 RepID=UPI001CD0A2D3|nr:bifunctional transcriptional activator/DNA repair enzyme AdaA [Paenibacillus vietnamensis]MCA0754803.1 bifunctional transcriptional activator/DNA repair enzyme AdaA [Paenibacillus vietnamensis]
MTDEKWQAIIGNNSVYDGEFYYAVITTGIFCRPSCKSKPPKPENTTLFNTADQAISAGYRPCKRCRPRGLRVPDEEWIASVTDYIDRSISNRSLTLKVLADISHGSPYHLHRTFKRVTGLTPVEYIRQRRIGKAKELLLSTELSVAEAGACAGLPNASYFITLFKKITGLTPAEYRRLSGMNESEGLHDDK